LELGDNEINRAGEMLTGLRDMSLRQRAIALLDQLRGLGQRGRRDRALLRQRKVPWCCGKPRRDAKCNTALGQGGVDRWPLELGDNEINRAGEMLAGLRDMSLRQRAIALLGQ